MAAMLDRVRNEERGELVRKEKCEQKPKEKQGRGRPCGLWRQSSLGSRLPILVHWKPAYTSGVTLGFLGVFNVCAEPLFYLL